MLETKEVSTLTMGKVWNPNVLKWICIFLSAFSGITLYIINFYRLNRPGKQKKLIIGICVIVVVSVIAFFTPNYSVISSLLFLINIGIAIYFNYEQKELFYNHMQNGGKKASSAYAWILGILILLVVFSIFIVVEVISGL